MREPLKFGCTVEKDSDGDWVICPPANVNIFSEPGEGYLLGASNEEDAYKEAENYLSRINEDEV